MILTHGNKILKLTSKIIYFFPVFVYTLIVINDFSSTYVGDVLSVYRTTVLLYLNVLFLIAIWSFGLWCISKAKEIDLLWDYFEIKVAMNSIGKVSNAGNLIGVAETNLPETESPEIKNSETDTPNPTNKEFDKVYQRGIKGGCYCLSVSGKKIYVDRNLCN